MSTLPAPPLQDKASSPLSVLVVDDIAASRDTLASQVLSLGHACLTASSGEQALVMIPEVKPDLILLDLWMPGLYGFEVTRRLREQVTDRWLPVIVTSALQGEAHFIDALSRGADDYLARPVNADLLKVKLMHYARVLSLQSGLARLARREQLVHEHIPDAVLTLDAEGRLCEANRAARDLLARRSVAEPLGRALPDLLGPEIARWLLDRGDHGTGEQASDSQATALDLDLDLDLSAGHGQTLPVAVSASRWHSGHAEYFTLVLRDQTERRRVNRMKEEFLATVSHELRTPLTSIIGALGLMAAGVAGTLSPAAQDLLTVASRNAQRLSRLTDDVLDLTKLEGGGLQFSLQACVLAPVMLESVKVHSALAQRRGIELCFHDESVQANIQADPGRLLQVMANLLTNALRHTPEGSRVDVRLFGCAEGWCIEIQDQGPGISPEFRHRLFEKFAQEDSSDRRAQGGTGLGLHIARMLTERMGGRIGERNLPSVPGQSGACFFLVFPALRADQHRPRLLGVARDTLQLAQWREWLTPWADLDGVSSPELARARLAQDGPVRLILADPTAQGSADAFCAGLQRLVKPGGLMLVSDAVDAAFAARLNLPWVGRSAQVRQALQQAVRQALDVASPTGKFPEAPLTPSAGGRHAHP